MISQGSLVTCVSPFNPRRRLFGTVWFGPDEEHPKSCAVETAYPQDGFHPRRTEFMWLPIQKLETIKELPY